MNTAGAAVSLLASKKAGTAALARAVGFHRTGTPTVHTWEPSNSLLYSQGFLYSRYLAKSELCDMYSHIL